jgi:hypothetical protein
LVNFVAIKSRDFEVYTPKLDDVSYPDDLLLVIREEVFEDLIDRTFLADDHPHSPLQLHVVLFIFLHFFLMLRLIDLIEKCAETISIGYF